MQTISILLLEAAMRGGLSVPGPAIMTDEPGSPYAVHIPALDSLPDTFWVAVGHDPSPCGPHATDGLCGACENLAEDTGEPGRAARHRRRGLRRQRLRRVQPPRVEAAPGRVPVRSLLAAPRGRGRSARRAQHYRARRAPITTGSRRALGG